MSGARRRELAQMLEDGRSEARRRDFLASERAVARWEGTERAHGASGLSAALAWTGQLRSVFGDPPADRRPWVGNDFRL